MIEAAGKDISHWFDKKTKDVSGCNLPIAWSGHFYCFKLQRGECHILCNFFSLNSTCDILLDFRSEHMSIQLQNASVTTCQEGGSFTFRHHVHGQTGLMILGGPGGRTIPTALESYRARPERSESSTHSHLKNRLSRYGSNSRVTLRHFGLLESRLSVVH